MFFILSKTLDYLLMPFLWVLLLLLLALFLKSAKKKRLCLVAALGILVVLSNPFILNEAWRAWEVKAMPVSQVQPHDVAVILTGVTRYRNEIPDRVHTNKGADRMLQPLQLYRMGKINKFLISGGSGALLKKQVPEAEQVKRILLLAGVPQADILTEQKSRNTHENAVYSAQVLAQHPEWTRVLLVTSAFHMRRSEGCFRKAGVSTTPYSTDFYVRDRSYTLDETVIPSIEVFTQWHLLLHEVAGYMVYKLLGYC